MFYVEKEVKDMNFKKGDIVRHKLTKDKLIVVGKSGEQGCVVVRKPDYSTVAVSEEEVELVK